jgi:hypothetical protein
MNLKEDWPLWVAGLAVVGVFVVGSQSSAPAQDVAGAQGGYTYAQDPNAVAAAAQTSQANLAAQAQYENGLLGAFGALVSTTQAEMAQKNQLTLQQEADATGLELQQLRNGAAVTSTNAATQVATLELQQQQAQFDAALHEQQQAGLWHDIFSLGGTLAAHIPFEQAVTSNTLPAFGTVGENVATATYQ